MLTSGSRPNRYGTHHCCRLRAGCPRAASEASERRRRPVCRLRHPRRFFSTNAISGTALQSYPCGAVAKSRRFTG